MRYPTRWRGHVSVRRAPAGATHARAFLALVMILLLGAVALPAHPAQAAPSAQTAPTDWAGRFPADTSIYFSMRTDDGVIENLDRLYVNLAPTVLRLSGLPPGQFRSIRDLLNLAVMDMGGSSPTCGSS